MASWKELDKAFLEQAKEFIKKHGVEAARKAAMKAFEETEREYFGDYIDEAIRKFNLDRDKINYVR